MSTLELAGSSQLHKSGPGWTLHLGDCLAGLRELADDSVDVTISDPPYEAEAHTKGRRQKGKSTRPGSNQAFRGVKESPLNFIPITARQRKDIALEIARVTRGWAVVFCQAEAIDAWRVALQAGGLRYRRSIPWVKPDAMPSLHGRWPGQSYEAIVAASDHNDNDWNAIVLASRAGAQPCPLGGKAIEYRFTRQHVAHDASPHPTTKPLPLMLKLVEHFSRVGDLILDPFAGSGSTGVACRILGRRFLGWELDAAYHEIACRRLRGEEAKPRVEQPGLFDA